jgi:hypothetical protein
MSIIIRHNSGFFSCCSVKLHEIIDYINFHKTIPNHVDSSAQFSWYKRNQQEDITYEYFEHYDNILIPSSSESIINSINYHNVYQFINYSNLDYINIIPIVKKYFSPSKQIYNIIENIETKYKLDYDNICVLFYRGNDKCTETSLCNYNEYVEYANQILKNNPTIVFLIQSDETEFINYILRVFPKNSFYFKDETRNISKCKSTVDFLMKNTNYIFSKYYLAITVIMSKCKYIICGSGNCSIWIMFYRGNNNNVYQNLNGMWLIKEIDNLGRIVNINNNNNQSINVNMGISNIPITSSRNNKLSIRMNWR